MSEILLDTLVVRLVGDASRYEAMLARSALSTQSWATQVVQAGKLLTGGVVLPLLGLGAAATKAFSDVDDSMTRIAARFSRSGDSIKGALEDTARSISRTSTSSVADLEKGYTSLHAAGFSSVQSVQALGVAQKFAVGAQEDLGRATKTLAEAQDALGLRTNDPKQNAENLSKISDGLLRLSQSTGKSVEEITHKLEQSTDSAKERFRAFMETARGTSADTAKSIESTFGAQTTMLWNRIKDSAFQLGEVLNPAMVRFNQLAGNGLGWWDQVVDKIRYGDKGIVDAISHTKLWGTSLDDIAESIVAFSDNKTRFVDKLLLRVRYSKAAVDALDGPKSAGAVMVEATQAAEDARYEASIKKKKELALGLRKIQDGMGDDQRARDRALLDSLGEQKKAVEDVTKAKVEQHRLDGQFITLMERHRRFPRVSKIANAGGQSGAPSTPWSSGMDPTADIGEDERDPLTGKPYADALVARGLDPITGQKNAATRAAEAAKTGVDPYTGRLRADAARGIGVDSPTGRRLGRLPTSMTKAHIASERPGNEKSAEGMVVAAYKAREADWAGFSNDPYQGASFHGNALDRGPESRFYSDGPRSTAIKGKVTRGGSLSAIMSDSAQDANSEAERQFARGIREKARRDLISRNDGVLTPDEQRQMSQIQKENSEDAAHSDLVSGMRSSELLRQNTPRNSNSGGALLMQQALQGQADAEMKLQTKILQQIADALQTRTFPAVAR